MAGDPPRRRRERDSWADAPDRFDRADREWQAKWAAPKEDADADDLEPVGAGYVKRKATPGYVSDAYGDGMREAGTHLGTGMQIAASMLLFVGLGLAADRWLAITPWGTIVGAALGMVGVVALVLRMARDGEETSRSGTGPRGR